METVSRRKTKKAEGGLNISGWEGNSCCAVNGKKVNALFAFLLGFVLLFIGMGVPSGGAALADEGDAALAPGTYTITANLAMPGAYNPVLKGMTVYTNSPNNPFGPTYDENDKSTVQPSIPNASESLNAQLIVGEDGSKTLYLPIKNPIFTTQDLGTCADLKDVKAERVAPTHKVGNTGGQEGSYGNKESRIHKMTATLADDKTIGVATYNFKGSVLYAVPLDKELAPEGDIALQLTVDYGSAKKVSDGTEVPSLETEKIVVNTPEDVSIPYTASDNSQVTTIGYKTAAVKIEAFWGDIDENGNATITGRDIDTLTYSLTDTDKYVWSDGTTGEKEVTCCVGKVQTPSKVKRIYNGQVQEYPAALYGGAEITGTLSATDAGEYAVTATLKDGFQWENKNLANPYIVKWSIEKKTLYPQSVTTIKEGQTPNFAADLVYVEKNGDTESGFVKGETAETAISEAPTASIQDMPEGITRAEDLPAGEYTVYWDGGSAKNYTWPTMGMIVNWFAPSKLIVEEADTIAVPSAKGGLVYTGADQQGIESSDAYTLSGDVAAKNAGTYTVKVTPNPGYKWEDGTRDAKEVTWIISRASLTATYTGGTMTYGDASLSQNIAYSGFVNGETAETAAGFVAPTVSAPANVNVNGEYQVAPQGGEADNYEFTYAEGTLKVLPVGTAAIPQGASCVYNGKVQNGVPESKAYSCSGDASAKNCGTYSATLALNSGYVWEDGTTEPKTVEWSIAKKTLTAKYEGETIVYGETPALMVGISGFADGETAETAEGFVSPVVTADSPMVPASTQTLTPAGGAADNYAFEYVSGTLTVNPLGEIDVPAASTNLVYNGKERCAFGDIAEGAHYRLSGDTFATNAGVYTAVAKLEEGYVWKDGTTADIEIKWVLSKATLTAKYVDHTMDANGAFEGKVTVDGFVNGETEATAEGYVAPTVAKPESVEAGKSYELYPANGSAANYEFDYQSGTLKINAAANGGKADNGGAAHGTGVQNGTTAGDSATTFAQTNDSTAFVFVAALAFAALSFCVALGAYVRKRSK